MPDNAHATRAPARVWSIVPYVCRRAMTDSERCLASGGLPVRRRRQGTGTRGGGGGGGVEYNFTTGTNKSMQLTVDISFQGTAVTA